MRKSTILIVDDTPDNIYLMEVILKNHGFDTISAKNGREAVEKVKIKENGIDLILMDVMMPEMDGFEASRAIREMEGSEHVPIILVTAKKRESTDVIRGLGEGAVEYLTKPFDDEELLARINSMLRIKHLHDDNRKLLTKVLAQQKQIELELKIAEHVQKAMLPPPEKLKENKKFRIETFYRTATILGGDFYDFMEYGENRFAFLLADVTGHGASAALIVAMLKTVLDGESADRPSPAKLVERINSKLLHMTPDDHFITLCFCVVDISEKTITYCCAGHPSPFLFGAGRSEVLSLGTTGMTVALFESDGFGEKTVTFEKGDKLFIYSDGIFEVLNKDAMYGMENIKKYLLQNREAPANEVLEGLIKDVEQFWDKESERDDIAALMIEFL